MNPGLTVLRMHLRVSVVVLLVVTACRHPKKPEHDPFTITVPAGASTNCVGDYTFDGQNGRPDASTDHAGKWISHLDVYHWGLDVTKQEPPCTVPTCNDLPSAVEQWRCVAKQWQCFEERLSRDFSYATWSGFAAPSPVSTEGSDIVMRSDDIAHIDWSHPVGFAVIDCDRKSTMLDGKTAPLAVEISWDPERSCLHVTSVISSSPRKGSKSNGVTAEVLHE